MENNDIGIARGMKDKIESLCLLFRILEVLVPILGSITGNLDRHFFVFYNTSE
jgi:hypothetical protein